MGHFYKHLFECYAIWECLKRILNINALIMHMLLAYELPAIFFGAFFFGEMIILSAAFLAGQDVWSIGNVFWLAFAGTVLSDMLWFVFGRSLTSATYWQKAQKTYGGFLRRLDRLTGQRPFLSLLFIKFVYGTRVLTIIYLSVRKIRLWQFLLFDAVGTVLWLGVMLSVGWLAGRGVVNVLGAVHQVEYGLLGLILLILLFKYATVWIEKYLTKK